MRLRFIALLDESRGIERLIDLSIEEEDSRLNCQDFIEKLWHSISKLEKYDGNFSLYFFLQVVSVLL